MAKIWENRNGKCYCHGQLMTNPGCHGANCRTCCYGLGKSEAGFPTIPPINPGTPARKVWENVNGKCYCYGVLMSNPGCHGANCRTCCYGLGKREAGSPTIPFPPTDPKPQAKDTNQTKCWTCEPSPQYGPGIFGCKHTSSMAPGQRPAGCQSWFSCFINCTPGRGMFKTGDEQGQINLLKHFRLGRDDDEI
jgi:hypothetical protein